MWLGGIATAAPSDGGYLYFYMNPVRFGSAAEATMFCLDVFGHEVPTTPFARFVHPDNLRTSALMRKHAVNHRSAALVTGLRHLRPPVASLQFAFAGRESYFSNRPRPYASSPYQPLGQSALLWQR